MSESTEEHPHATSQSGQDASPPTNDAQHRAEADTENHTFELVSTILLALAAIAIAWAGFQSAKWGGVQATNTSQAGAARTESVRFSTLAGQQTQVDVSTFFIWVEAVVDDIESGAVTRPATAADYEPTAGTLSGFTFERMRDEFKPAFSAWLDSRPFVSAEAPGTPFDLPEYQLVAADEAEALQTEAELRASEAGDANQTSDNYVVTAVLFATALFFAALSGKLKHNRFKIGSLALAGVVFLGTLAFIFTLAIEV